MKVFVVFAEAFIPKENESKELILADVNSIFSSREKAVAYITNTWPYAIRVCDDDFGEYWTFGPDESFSWIARYQILEEEVV